MAITYFGQAQMPSTDGADAATTSMTITPPGSMTSGQYVVLYVYIKANETQSITTDGGQTWTSETAVTGSNRSLRAYHCRYDGTWDANPVVSWTSSVPYAAWMTVWDGVDTSTGKDAGTSGNGYGAPSSPFNVQIPASTITTVTAAALVLGAWGSNDDNTWTVQTSGWAHPGSQNQWRNVGGSDCSLSLAYKVQAAAGGNEAVDNQQTALGGDVGAYDMIALRAASGSTPALVSRKTLLGVGV